jgi:membrane-associated phospholipid phosphatase
MGKRPQSLLDREIPIRWVIGLFVVLISTAVFLELAGDVWLKEGFAWDAPLMLAIHRLTTPWLTRIMWLVTQTGGPATFAILAAIAFWLWRQHRGSDALMLAISWAGAVLLSTALKLLFARPRPQVFPPLVPGSGFSFPSGHTLAAVGLYGMLAAILWRERHHVAALFCALWVLLVGLSRVYLGVHYPSDVLASLTLGVIWVAVVLLGRHGLHAFRARPADRER